MKYRQIIYFSIDFSVWDSVFPKKFWTIMLEPVIEPNALYRYHTVFMYRYGPLQITSLVFIYLQIKHSIVYSSSVISLYITQAA
jgi:hypothetical protein